MKKKTSCVMFSVLFALCGCSGAVISKQIRAEATPISGFDEVRQNPDKFKDRTIIVGGEIINVRNHEDQSTTLVVLAFPLDGTEMPEKWANGQGRFMVKTSEFLDPVVYRQGRNVTVAGIVTGVEVEPVGDLKYRYVVMKSLQIYLWPRLYPRRVYMGYPYWHRYPYEYEYWEPWWEPE